MRKNPARTIDWIEEKHYRRSRRRNRERSELAVWLRKRAKTDPTLIAKADALDDCKPGRRCRSPICPECIEAHRRLLTATIYRFLKKQSCKGNIAVVSIVPADGILSPGPISPDIYQRLIRRWKQRLNRAGIDWFCGGVDISFNEHAKAKFQPHWSIHIFGFCATDDFSALKLALKKEFKATEIVRRPVKALQWDGKRRAIRYALKNKFWRRITLGRAETAKKRRTTDKQRLRTSEKLNLITFLIHRPNRVVFLRSQLIAKKSRFRFVKRWHKK